MMEEIFVTPATYWTDLRSDCWREPLLRKGLCDGQSCGACVLRRHRAVYVDAHHDKDDWTRRMFSREEGRLLAERIGP